MTHCNDTLDNSLTNDTHNDTPFSTQHIVMNLLVLSGRCRDDDPQLLSNPCMKPISLLKDQGAR